MPGLFRRPSSSMGSRRFASVRTTRRAVRTGSAVSLMSERAGGGAGAASPGHVSRSVNTGGHARGGLLAARRFVDRGLSRPSTGHRCDRAARPATRRHTAGTGARRVGLPAERGILDEEINRVGCGTVGGAGRSPRCAGSHPTRFGTCGSPVRPVRDRITPTRMPPAGAPTPRGKTAACPAWFLTSRKVVPPQGSSPLFGSRVMPVAGRGCFNVNRRRIRSEVVRSDGHVVGFAVDQVLQCPYAGFFADGDG